MTCLDFRFRGNLGSMVFQSFSHVLHFVAEGFFDLFQLFPIGFELLSDAVPFLRRGILELLDEFFLFGMEFSHFRTELCNEILYFVADSSFVRSVRPFGLWRPFGPGRLVAVQNNFDPDISRFRQFLGLRCSTHQVQRNQNREPFGIHTSIANTRGQFLFSEALSHAFLYA